MPALRWWDLLLEVADLKISLLDHVLSLLNPVAGVFVIGGGGMVDVGSSVLKAGHNPTFQFGVRVHRLLCNGFEGRDHVFDGLVLSGDGLDLSSNTQVMFSPEWFC